MVTLYAYSDAVVFSSTMNSQLFAMLDGSYGKFSKAALSKTFERFDGILGWVDSAISTRQDSIAHNQFVQMASGRYVESGLIYPEDRSMPFSFFQLYSANGAALGSAHQIGGGIHVSAPESIVSLATGGFVVSWNQYDPTILGTRWDGAFQVFDRRGVAVGDVVKIAIAGDQQAPVMATLGDTNLIATWIDKTDGWKLTGQVFSLDGVAQAAAFTLATEPGNYTTALDLATFDDGSFSVMWTSEVSDPNEGSYILAYKMRHFAADGTPLGAEVEFAKRTSGHIEGFLTAPQMIGLADGRIAVAWTESIAWPDNGLSRQYFDQCLLRIYEKDGTAASPTYAIGAGDGLDYNLNIVALTDGRIAASWSHWNTTNHANDEVTQIFDSRDKAIVLLGDSLNNQYAGTSLNDKLSGAAGDDTLFGNAGNDKIFGGRGKDVLLGGFDRDALFGGDGNDVLSGFGGADRLTGGRGSDLLIGGGGKDVFVFAPGDGLDKIQNFEDGQDRLDLSRYDFATLAFALDHFAKVDGGVMFSNGTDEIFVVGLTLANLSGDDLLWV